jgi:2-polyprenyl-3-methyl-5-hydroxy-6-metoxy-1,4-benzoquinol methylase
MAEFTVCNLCNQPNRALADATDMEKVAANVRAFGTESFTVWRCSGCGSLHSKEDIDLDRYYENYPFKSHKMRPGVKVAYQNRLRCLKKWGLLRSHRILDFGCGQGLFVQYLQEQGYDAQGYDAFVADFADPTILNTDFDAIVSQDVIEHVNDPATFLTEQVQALSPDGLLVVGTPNASEIDLKDLDRYLLELHQPYHRHILSEAALIELAAQQGLSLIEVHRRFYSDTPFPFINQRFVWEYVKTTGNYIDAIFEMDKAGKAVIRSPKLLTLGLLGYFFPYDKTGNMMVAFRKTP